MQINLSLTVDIVMGLLLMVVGILQVYQGFTKEIQSIPQAAVDLSDIDPLSDSAQEIPLSGFQMTKEKDYFQITSGVLLMVIGVLKAFFSKQA